MTASFSAMLLVLAVAVAVPATVAAPSTASRAQVVRLVTKLGGRVEHRGGGISAIDLRGTWVTDADLRRLRGCNMLRRIDLGYTRITDQGLLEIRDLRSVTDLDLRWAELVTDAGITHIKGWKALRRLDLRGTRVSDSAMAVLAANMPALRALDVGFTLVMDAGAQQLSQLGELRELALGGNKLTDQAMAIAYSLPHLQVLVIGGRQRANHDFWTFGLTDAGLDPLTELRELSTLDLSGTTISAAGLTKLGGLASLAALNLHNASRVNDDSVPALRALGGLRFLDISGTAMTSVGVEALRQALPRLQIVDR